MTSAAWARPSHRHIVARPELHGCVRLGHPERPAGSGDAPPGWAWSPTRPPGCAIASRIVTSRDARPRHARSCPLTRHDRPLGCADTVGGATSPMRNHRWDVDRLGDRIPGPRATVTPCRSRSATVADVQPAAARDLREVIAGPRASGVPGRDRQRGFGIGSVPRRSNDLFSTNDIDSSITGMYGCTSTTRSVRFGHGRNDHEGRHHRSRQRRHALARRSPSGATMC